MSSGDSRDNVSITLPFNSTTRNGEEYTYWNLGSVAAGGVADSWHSEGGPGKFVAHNNGEAGAYVYLTSSEGMYERWKGRTVQAYEICETSDELMGLNGIRPVPSLRYLKNQSKYEQESYCLAFSKDVTAKVPTWHMLDRYLKGGSKYAYNGSNESDWRTGDEYDGDPVGYVVAYMGILMPVNIWRLT